MHIQIIIITLWTTSLIWLWTWQRRRRRRPRRWWTMRRHTMKTWTWMTTKTCPHKLCIYRRHTKSTGTMIIMVLIATTIPSVLVGARRRRRWAMLVILVRIILPFYFKIRRASWISNVPIRLIGSQRWTIKGLRWWNGVITITRWITFDAVSLVCGIMSILGTMRPSFSPIPRYGRPWRTRIVRFKKWITISIVPRLITTRGWTMIWHPLWWTR